MKPVAIAAAVVLLVLAAFGLWQWQDVAPAAPAPDHTGEAAIQRTLANAPGNDAATNTNDSPREVGDAPANGTVRLLVVNAADEPVPGAEVRYWPLRSEAVRVADVKRWYECGDLEVALKETGAIATTDLHGRVTIVADPESDGCVRSGNDYAEFDLAERAPSATVEERVTLQRDLAVRVEVVDTRGKPVAGKVVVAHGEKLPPTDAAGQAVLAHALREWDYHHLVAGDVVTFQIARRTSDASTELLAKQVVSIETLVREPTVRLTIAAGGTIAVQTKDADGVLVGCSVWLEDEHGNAFDIEPAWAAGSYTFRNVPCGRRWKVVVKDGWRLIYTDEIFDRLVLPVVGPRSEDEVVRVAVNVPIRKSWLRCRIVRSDGCPVARVRITATSPAFADELGDRGAGGDDDGVVGRFRFSTRSAVTDLAPLTLRIESPFCRPTTVVINKPLPPGEHDLGDLAVEPPIGEQLLASVELRAAGRPAPPGGEVRLLVAGSERDDDVPTWTREVDGIVQLHGVPPNHGMLLACSHPQFLRPTWQPIGVGQHRVVDLQPPASLRVDVIANGLPLDSVEGRLQRVGDEHDDCEQLTASMQAIRWPRLAPGRYSLRLMLGEHVLHETFALDLVAGNNRWPGDGSRIDLRGKVRVRRIDARRAGGGNLGTDLLVVEPSLVTLPPQWEDRIIQDPWFLVPDRPHDVLVRGWGYVPQRLPSTGPDVLLRMQPCTRLDCDRFPEGGAVRVRILDDAVTDPLLRAFDFHPHGAEFEATDDRELLFAPGTVLELTPVRDGTPGAPHRVVVGATSPQPIELRW